MRTLPRFIGLLQVDSTVGNLTGNASRIERLASIAKEHGAAMAVSTELAISGYPPRDLLLQPDFINMSFDKATSLDVEIPVLVGTPVPTEDSRSLPANGVVRSGLLHAQPNGENTNRIVAKKQLLPSYDVFDETRYFLCCVSTSVCNLYFGVALGAIFFDEI